MTGYADFYRRSIDDRDGFWTEQAGLISPTAHREAETAKAHRG